jgi:ubiquinone/menaquinone biosynthesis C-methylase UbiE
MTDQVRNESQKLWNVSPCGSGDHLTDLEYASKEFFDEVRRSRYEDTDRWIKEVIDFDAVKGKRLLEIGHGMGTDLLTFCEHGAEVHAIDIVEEHHRLAEANFRLHGMPCDLRLCDATAVDFPSDFFDIVFSLGVMHHIPEIESCISEAHRVLKPGGLFIIALYNKFSAFHIFQKIFYDGLRKGMLFSLGYRGLMATVERGADGKAVCPLVRTYSARDMRRLLRAFSPVEIKVAHFKREHLAFFRGRFMPRSMEKILEPRLGWYVVAHAVKSLWHNEQKAGTI